MSTPTREQLKAQERALVQERGQQENYLRFCEVVPFNNQESRESLLDTERGKLREIETNLGAVREALRYLPPDPPPAAPTPS